MIGWLIARFRPHQHNMVDVCVFDSCTQYTLGTSKRRILGMAVLTYCYECGASGRRPLKTWAEARIARKLLGYGQPKPRTASSVGNREAIEPKPLAASGEE